MNKRRKRVIIVVVVILIVVGILMLLFPQFKLSVLNVASPAKQGISSGGGGGV